MNRWMNLPVSCLLLLAMLGLTSSLTKAQSVSDSVLYNADHAAQFPGGMGEFHAFIRRSVHYPASALAEQVRQKVNVQMTITQRGTITNIILPTDLRTDFEVEARRVISLMPRWLPAAEQHQFIDSTVLFFIHFIPPTP